MFFLKLLTANVGHFYLMNDRFNHLQTTIAATYDATMPLGLSYQGGDPKSGLAQAFRSARKQNLVIQKSQCSVEATCSLVRSVCFAFFVQLPLSLSLLLYLNSSSLPCAPLPSPPLLPLSLFSLPLLINYVCYLELTEHCTAALPVLF